MTSPHAKVESAPGVTASTKSPRILVVDDEEQVQRLLKTILSRHHYDVVLASTGDQALDRAVDHAPDLVILDLTLPGMSGLEVCRELRSWLAAPILVLSGRGEEAVKVKALDQGADDYITKPFATGELLARLRALLRRASTLAAPMPVIQSGDLAVDVARRRVFYGQKEVRLTRTEFDILAYLARNGGCVVTSKMLVEQVWGPRYTDDTQTLRVHVGHLRKKIEPDPAMPRYILTEPGVGYRFAAV